MTPITIGDQKFVKDVDRGWIDAKTKQPADKGLIRLLDSLVIDEPVLKKLRVKIDRTVDPVSINGQKFVYDSNQGWIDEKTKVKASDSLQKVLSSASPRSGIGNEITGGFGMAAQKTRPKVNNTGGGTLVGGRNAAVNKPIIEMITALASIDGFLKQRLENQKLIIKNNNLNNRESQIESPAQQDVVTTRPDAERVSPSSGGLLALGGLALLTLDPVQEAIKDIADGVIDAGKFITSVVSTINSAFTFLFSKTGMTDPTATESAPAPDATPNVGAPPGAGTPQAIPKETPSLMNDVASGASTGALIGSVVPRVGGVVGAVAGAAVGAYKHFTSGGQRSSAAAPSGGSDATTSSAPQATPTSALSSKPAAQATPAPAGGGEMSGEIPKNDIVALGNYLAGKGADKSKMENMALSGRVGSHSPNSRHKRGMAIDVNFPGPNEAAILDQLEPQLRAAGYNTIWRKPGHTTHMHVSVGGPEGSGGGSYGDSDGMMGAVGNAVEAGVEKVGELLGILGGSIIKPGVTRKDLSVTINAAAKMMNTETAVSKTPKPPVAPMVALPPRINKGSSGAPQNAATQSDKDSVYYYLRRFGYQDLNTPQATLKTV